MADMIKQESDADPEFSDDSDIYDASDPDMAVAPDQGYLQKPTESGGDTEERPNIDTKPKKKKRMSRAQRRKAKQQKVRIQEGQENPDRFDKREIIKENANMVTFYQSQGLFDEKEFEQFMECLRTTLPASFRINTFDYEQANILRQLIEKQFQDFVNSNEASEVKQEIQEEEEESKEGVTCPVGQADTPATIPALECLEWYPKRMAWQMNITRIDLRKSAILRSLHQFIQAETDNGYISRQESVSMIPPLVLDVQRGQNILDMCAAPGSKTAQLLEYLKFSIHDQESRREDSQNQQIDKNLFDDGIVVANDVDNKRCYMLVHQSKRLNSPNCVIINEDASRMPKIQSTPPVGGIVKVEDDKSEMKFDRILCDAPCSGDGTIRKNPDVWRKWTIGNANNFHGLQSKILRRGVELLADNGLIVYSTCSMNPVEDEAVVANILRLGEGKLVLEDCSQKLKGLKYRPGLTSWVVMDTNMKIVSSFDEVKPEQTSQLHKSIFKPSEEEIKRFHLDRCIRIFPHYQNTGAFFVAVIRKLAPKLPHELIERTIYLDSAGRVQPPKPKRRRFGFKEDPFAFISKDDKDWLKIKEFYGLSDGFPEGQLTHRCKSTSKRSIYLVSRQTREFILANEEIEGRQSFVKIINAGMRTFVRAETDAGFRMCQDGINEILPYVRADLRVPTTKRDLIFLLERKGVPFHELSSAEQFKDKLRVGSCILMYKHSDSDSDLAEVKHQDNDQSAIVEMPLVAWRGERSVSLYVSNTYKVHLRSLVQGKIVSCDNVASEPQAVAAAASVAAAETVVVSVQIVVKQEKNGTEEDCARTKTIVE